MLKYAPSITIELIAVVLVILVIRDKTWI